MVNFRIGPTLSSSMLNCFRLQCDPCRQSPTALSRIGGVGLDNSKFSVEQFF